MHNISIIIRVICCCCSSGKHGQMAEECCEAYYYYGVSLLELARLENGVLGNALKGGTRKYNKSIVL